MTPEEERRQLIAHLERKLLRLRGILARSTVAKINWDLLGSIMLTNNALRALAEKSNKGG